MASSEDVLERADKWVRGETHWGYCEGHELVILLAAEVRELRAEQEAAVESMNHLADQLRALRKDRERLRGDLHRIVGQAFDLGTTHPGGPSGFALHQLTELVDSAMAAEREDPS